MSNNEKRSLGEQLIKAVQELSNGDVGRVTEVNTIKCKVCNELKTRIEAGKFPGKGNIKKYVDQFGKAFNGKTCPDCNKSRMKNVMRAGRLGKNSTNS